MEYWTFFLFVAGFVGPLWFATCILPQAIFGFCHCERVIRSRRYLRFHTDETGFPFDL